MESLDEIEKELKDTKQALLVMIDINKKLLEHNSFVIKEVWEVISKIDSFKR